MIRHIWTVYCQDVLIDRQNNVSMIRVIDQITLGPEADGVELYEIPVSSKLITLWTREEWDTPVTSKMRMRFIGPDGSELPSSAPSMVVDLQEHLRSRVTGELDNLLIKGSGTHEWVVERLDEGKEDSWIEEARIPVEIKIKRSDEGS